MPVRRAVGWSPGRSSVPHLSYVSASRTMAPFQGPMRPRCGLVISQGFPFEQVRGGCPSTRRADEVSA